MGEADPPVGGDRDAVAEARWYSPAQLRDLIAAKEAAEAQIRHLREREAHFANVLGVCDGGQYRNDWDVRITRVLSAKEAAEARVKELEAALAWRPMADAPRDVRVLVAFMGEGPLVAYADPCEPSMWRRCIGFGKSERFATVHADYALGWLPLPPAPEVPRA